MTHQEWLSALREGSIFFLVILAVIFFAVVCSWAGERFK